MKKYILIAMFFIGVQANAQWAGAVLDSLTHNTERDEVSRRCIAIDDNGNLHVVFIREVAGAGWNIFYRQRNQASVWSPEDSVTGMVGFSPSITALNVAGEAAVAYSSVVTTGNDIFVGVNPSGVWYNQQITSDTTEDFSPTIDNDGSDMLHVAWIGIDSVGDYKIKYATDRSGSWVIQELSNSQLGPFGGGASPQIVADKNGVVHIAYRGGNFGTYRIVVASNQTPGGTTWTYDYPTSPNAEDLIGSICVDNDTVVHLLVSGNDGFGFPSKAYYMTKAPGASSFTTAVPVASAFSAEVGDLFVDNGNHPHCVLNEVSGNIYTGNVIYANGLNVWFGDTLISSMDTYNASIVIDEEGHGYVAGYRGNAYPDEEVVIYGSQSSVDVPAIELKGSPVNIRTIESGLNIFFNDNFAGSISCLSIEGKVVYEKTGNYLKGDHLK